ncbi:MAG: sigma-70 family RNA polymerase sigma factor [Pirellulales bacterium]|nr:sigma-70 family RNA polymerase sigma factor [Pirellulales bacterium]
MADSDKETLQRLIEHAGRGDTSALAKIFDMHRNRLYRMITMRLDPRLRSRLNPSDVLQESFFDASRRLHEYAQDPKFSAYFWLRNIVSHRLHKLHRHHLDAQLRDAKREISLDENLPGASKVYLAEQLAASSASVDRQLVQAEVQSRVERALDEMEEKDREVIALRHFEELSTEETAAVLGLTRSGVLKRYTRVLRKLRDAIGSDIELP